jgi:hypothetical protein
MTDPQVYTPTCYQTAPIGKVAFHVWPSPTFNQDSHRLWASRHVMILDELHSEFPPTHFFTIKFHRPESVETLKSFSAKMTDAVWHFNKSKDRYIAGRWVLEIEKDNACHLHILVRAGVYPDATEYFTSSHNPFDWLKKTTSKINAKLGTIATVQYGKPIVTIEGASKYVYKLGQDDILLFARRLRLRQTGQFGNYFAGKSQVDLRKNRRAALILTRLEMQAHQICGDGFDDIGENHIPSSSLT